MVKYVFALDWWIGIGWLSAHESPTQGEHLFPRDALLKDPAQTMGLTFQTAVHLNRVWMLGCGNFIYTLEIMVRILNPV